MPNPGGLCQGMQRLGPRVMRGLYEHVAVPCAPFGRMLFTFARKSSPSRAGPQTQSSHL